MKRKCSSCRHREATIGYKTCLVCREKFLRWREGRNLLEKQRRAAKLCRYCGDPPEAGVTTCGKHRVWWNSIQKNRAHRKMALGQCLQCLKPPEPGHTMCKRHLKEMADGRKFNDLGTSYHNDTNRNERYGLPYKDGYREKIRDGMQIVPIAAAYPMVIPPTQLEGIDREELQAGLKRLLEGMDEKLRLVVESRRGLFGRRKLTLQRLGDKLGVTRERARQLERDAMAWVIKRAYQDPQLTQRFGKRILIVQKCRRRHLIHCPACLWLGGRTGRQCTCKDLEAYCDPYTGPRGCPHNVMRACPKCGGEVQPGHPEAFVENYAVLEAVRVLQRAFMKANG